MHPYKCVQIFSRILQSRCFFSAYFAMKYFSLPSFLRETSGIATFAIETRENQVLVPFFPIPFLMSDRFSFFLLTANFNIHENININKNININIDIYEYECRCVNIHGTEYYTRIESSRKANRRRETKGSNGRRAEGELQVQTIPGSLKGTPSTPFRRRYRQRSHSYKRRRKPSRR